MDLSKVTRVVFNEENHTYLLDGERYLKGVTTIMRENGLSPEYGDIDPEVLAHAAKMGSMAHKAIEDYCNGIAVESTKLIDSFKDLLLDVVCCEYLVTDYNSIASSIDMVVKVDESTVDLIDMKRTSEVHMDALSWQLGIYKYLFERENPTIKVRNCYCLHIKKGLKNSIDKDTCKPLILINPAKKEHVEELIDCVQNGLPFEKPVHNLPVPFTSEEQLYLSSLERNLAHLEISIKQAKEKIESYREKVYNHMLSNNLDTLALNDCIYKLKRPYQVQSIDTKRLKEEMPEIAERYTQIAERKGSLTFSLRYN